MLSTFEEKKHLHRSIEQNCATFVAYSLTLKDEEKRGLQASARGMNCTTQSTALFLLNRGRDHKQAQITRKSVRRIFRATEISPWQQKTCPLALFSGVSGYLVLFAINPKNSPHGGKTKWPASTTFFSISYNIQHGNTHQCHTQYTSILCELFHVRRKYKVLSI